MQQLPKRNFPNFLDAYLEYARDEYVPTRFHFWTGLVTIAAALERKIWIEEFGHMFFPNIYVMLVGRPSVGKSAALSIGTSMLEVMRTVHNKEFNIVPQVITDASFLRTMTRQQSFSLGSQYYNHASGFYYASEASAAFKNVFGDFFATLTEFYDCTPSYKKMTEGRGLLEINNVCMNLIVGSTFDYLKRIVTEESVHGGFASRLIYVIYDEKKKRTSSMGQQLPHRNREYRAKLLQDLVLIHNMKGKMTVETEVAELHAKWFAEEDQKMQDIPSERMQSLIARKQNHLKKLAMIFSASESDELIVRVRHWTRAREVADRVMENVSKVIAESITSNTQSQNGLNQLIMRSIGRPGHTASKHKIICAIMAKGFKPGDIDSTLKMLCDAKNIEIMAGPDATSYRLLIDPDHYL